MSQNLFGSGNGSGLAGGLPGGLKAAAAALLVHQLWKHARGQSSATANPGGESGGYDGPFGDILGRLFPTAAAGTATPGTTAPAAAPAERDYEGPFGDILGRLFPSSASGATPSAGGQAAATGDGGLMGGLGGLLDRLRGQGLGRQVDSWVGTDRNEPVSASDLERAIDPHEVDEVARRTGADRATVLEAVREMLPQMVDRMTPQGRVPQRHDDHDGGLGGLLGGLFGRR